TGVAACRLRHRDHGPVVCGCQRDAGGVTMKPHIDTWIGSILTPGGMTAHNTTISKAGTHFSVSSTDIPDPAGQGVIGLYEGSMSVQFDLDEARAVAQAMLAAADHYEAQVAALAAKEVA